MSASTVTRASVFFRIVSRCVVPRPPQPNNPTRTAELACMPRTSCGFRMVNAAAPVAVRKLRRPISSLFIAFSPSANQLFQKCLRRKDVLGLLRSTNFALNREGVPITGLFQQRDQDRKVYFALTYGNLAAELLGIG